MCVCVGGVAFQGDLLLEMTHASLLVLLKEEGNVCFAGRMGSMYVLSCGALGSHPLPLLKAGRREDVTCTPSPTSVLPS